MKLFEKIILYVVTFFAVLVLSALVYKEFKDKPILFSKKPDIENIEIKNLKIRVKAMERELGNLDKNTAIQSVNDTIILQKQTIIVLQNTLDSMQQNMKQNEQSINNIFNIFNVAGQAFSMQIQKQQTVEKEKKTIAKNNNPK